MKRANVHPRLVVLQIILAAFFLSVTVSASPQIILDEDGWDTPVGTWDPVFKTGTLTTDVTVTIEIGSDGITLDGNGHKLTGDGSSSINPGIKLHGRSYVTIQNLIIQEFGKGIWLENSSNNTIINVTTINTDNGFYFKTSCYYNTLICNKTTGYFTAGINLSTDCDHNTISGNTTNSNFSDAFGILLEYGCDFNNLIGNNCQFSNKRGISLFDGCKDNIFNGNLINDNLYGLNFTLNCTNNSLVHNNFRNNVVAFSLNQSSSSNQFFYNNFYDISIQPMVYGSPGNIFSIISSSPVIGGNHWSDKIDPDDDFDKIVDFPKYIRDDHYDYLPWVVPNGWPNPPVADAGDDQDVQDVSGLAYLDGSDSYDDEDASEDLSYFWKIVAQPAGSAATIDSPNSVAPTLAADVNGYYVISLKVTDTTLTDSNPDYVVVSFSNLNLKPIANSGNSQSVVEGETIILDGSGSYDPNGDELTYSWSIIDKPEGSLATIEDPTAVMTTLLYDMDGEYRVILIVNDGSLDSDPSEVTITIISTQDAVTAILDTGIETINTFDANLVFKNKKMGKVLTNKINAVLMKIDDGLYVQARNKLENDILKKTNGCALTGAPDKNDWIRTCPEQEQIYPLIIEAIQLLEAQIQ